MWASLFGRAKWYTWIETGDISLIMIYLPWYVDSFPGQIFGILYVPLLWNVLWTKLFLRYTDLNMSFSYAFVCINFSVSHWNYVESYSLTEYKNMDRHLFHWSTLHCYSSSKKALWKKYKAFLFTYPLSGNIRNILTWPKWGQQSEKRTKISCWYFY